MRDSTITQEKAAMLRQELDTIVRLDRYPQTEAMVFRMILTAIADGNIEDAPAVARAILGRNDTDVYERYAI